MSIAKANANDVVCELPKALGLFVNLLLASSRIQRKWIGT
jgi:hypothetical protein